MVRTSGKTEKRRPNRKIDRIVIFPHHSDEFKFLGDDSIPRAIVFIETYDPEKEAKKPKPFRKFEFEIYMITKNLISGLLRGEGGGYRSPPDREGIPVKRVAWSGHNRG